MRRWAEELVEADRRKDEFISMLGHELRNPLAGIVTAGHALRAHADDVATIQRAHDMIEQKSRHMARLVDDLLDVSRITHGKIEIDRECLDLNDLVGAWGREHRSLLEQEGISLVVELPGEAVWIEGDETRLIQVMENLLHNAGKFTGAGGRVTVRLTVDPSRNRAAVQVIDTGAGIEPELLPHLFEPFIQGDHSLDRRLGGLGVGLTLVKHLIELHGGEVAVHSEGSGRGSEFSFTLPLSRFEVSSRSLKAVASP